ncbi:MAG: hypothetical protein QXO64_03005 [Thermofilaceae archaeon]
MLLPEFTLYVDDSEESKRIEGLLQRAKLGYRRVVVGGELLGWLLLEYGAKPPVLVAGDRVLHGPEIERLAGVSDESPSTGPLELMCSRGTWRACGGRACGSTGLMLPGFR